MSVGTCYASIWFFSFTFVAFMVAWTGQSVWALALLMPLMVSMSSERKEDSHTESS